MSRRLPEFPPNASGDARQLPELRAALVALASDNGPWHNEEIIRTLNDAVGSSIGVSESLPVRYDVGRDAIIVEGPKGYAADELQEMVQGTALRSSNSMRWYRDTLADAQLVHVTAELCEVLFASLDSMPDSRVLEESDPPWPCALVVFEQPFIGIDSMNESSVRVDAMLWGRVRFPPRDRPWSLDDDVDAGYSMAAFRWIDPSGDLPEVEELPEPMRKLTGVAPLPTMWCPLGRADWVIGDRIDRPTHDHIAADSQVHRSMMEDRKLIAALWALVAQRKLVERTTVQPARASTRRLDRAGDRTDRSVEIVHLRRAEFTPRHSDGSTGRKVGVRYAVRPFWRNQAHGPGYSLRKLILIEAHMRGPDDAPLSHVERVYEVDR